MRSIVGDEAILLLQQYAFRQGWPTELAYYGVNRAANSITMYIGGKPYRYTPHEKFYEDVKLDEMFTSYPSPLRELLAVLHYDLDRSSDLTSFGQVTLTTLNDNAAIYFTYQQMKDRNHARGA